MGMGGLKSTFTRCGPEHMPSFVYTTVYKNMEFEGTGYKKSEAQNRSYFKVYLFMVNESNKPQDPPPNFVNSFASITIKEKPEVVKLDDLTRHKICKEKFDSYKSESSKRLSNFSEEFCEELGIFLALPDEFREHHLFGTLLKQGGIERLKRSIEFGSTAYLDDEYYNDTETQARLAAMRKVGSFNEYGNEQMSNQQYTLTQPSIIFNNSTYTCFSTCLLPDPINISGTGESGEDAFQDWLITLESHINNWAPASSNDFIKQIRSLPQPAKEHPLYYLWADDHPLRRLRHEFKEGSFNPYGNGMIYLKQQFVGGFNPYGNGQPLSYILMLIYFILTHDQYMTQNAVAFKSFSEQEKESRWLRYKKKNTTKPVAKKTRTKTVPNLTLHGGPVSSKNAANKSDVRVNKDGTIRLSKCSTIYATALARPFFWLDTISKDKDTIGMQENPCIPMFPAIRTRKFNAFARGYLGVQTATNHACISLAPWRLSNNGTGLNCVAASLLYSTSATTITDGTFNELDTATAWTGGAANLNTDYSTANLIVTNGVGIKYRVVGAGLRIKYVGAPLTRSGIVHAIEEPDHYTLNGMSVSTIGKYDNYYSKLLGAGWHTLTYTPVQYDEFEFEQDAVSNALWSTDPRSKHFMGFIVTGVGVTGDVFQYEAIVHYEAIGSAIRGKTDTMADPTGTAIVLNGVKVDNQQKVGETTLPNLLQSGASAITAGKDIVDKIMPYTAMATKLLGMA